ncbi:MAG TPA: TPM domain-containing protein [Vicinamibacteria bacterium]|jgi:uncharacterized protein
MRRLGIRVWAAAVLGAAAAAASAQSALPSLPPVPGNYFNDYASLVDAATAQRLESKLREFDRATSTQVLVVIFPELPWPSLEDFTIRAAEAWKVGRKGIDNGAILFVFVNDRRVRIEVGYGLEGALPDAIANRIVTEQIVPAFQQGRFSQGVEAGADAIMAATRGEYTAPAQPAARRRGGGGSILAVVALLLFINFVLGRRMSRGRYMTYGRRGRRGGWGGPIFWGGGGWGRGGGGFGGGGFGGGGFSGGGGSFGGGGASGRW